MITFTHATKKYDQKTALKDVTFTINDGEIVGLIGHNGAGKSTTIKALVSVIHLTSGSIEVDGLPLKDNRLTIKKKIGYVADSPDLFLRLTANEFWELVATSYEMTANECEKRLSQLMKLFDFTNHRYEVIESFSHGMRQKVFVIGALLSNPDIWILDEPLTGLDPQAAYDLKNMMKEHAQKGKTVIFSTHVLEVAEQLCDKILILKEGELIFNGSLEDLKEQNPGGTLEEIYLSLAGRKYPSDNRDNTSLEEAQYLIGEAQEEGGVTHES